MLWASREERSHVLREASRQTPTGPGDRQTARQRDRGIDVGDKGTEDRPWLPTHPPTLPAWLLSANIPGLALPPTGSSSFPLNLTDGWDSVPSERVLGESITRQCLAWKGARAAVLCLFWQSISSFFGGEGEGGGTLGAFFPPEGWEFSMSVSIIKFPKYVAFSRQWYFSS